MKWFIGPLSVVILLALGLPTFVDQDGVAQPAWNELIARPILRGFPAVFFGIVGAFCYAHGLMGLVAAYFMSRQAEQVRAFNRVLWLYASIFAVFTAGAGLATIYGWLQLPDLKIKIALGIATLGVPAVCFAALQSIVPQRKSLVAQFHGARLAADILTANWLLMLLMGAGPGSMRFGGYIVIGCAVAMAALDLLGFTHKE